MNNPFIDLLAACTSYNIDHMPMMSMSYARIASFRAAMSIGDFFSWLLFGRAACRSPARGSRGPIEPSHHNADTIYTYSIAMIDLRPTPDMYYMIYIILQIVDKALSHKTYMIVTYVPALRVSSHFACAREALRVCPTRLRGPGRAG